MEPASRDVSKCVAANHPSPLVVHTSANDVQEDADSQVAESQMTDLQMPDEWVECVLCTKWRLLPPGMKAESLSLTHWNCIDGVAWRPTGLNCNVPADAEEDVVSYLLTFTNHLTF